MIAQSGRRGERKRMRGDGYYFSSLRHSTDYGADGLQKLPAELGSVFHCLLLFTRIERKADKKRKLDHKKEKEWTDRSGCRTSIGEQRMQVDGFTAGVSLTERISRGFNIKDERSNQAQDPRRPSTTPPTLWTVAKTPASSCIKQQEEWLSK